MMAHANQKWTHEQDEMIRVMFAQGYSAARMGNEIGKSKNAVISRMNRKLGLSRRQSETRATHTADKPKPRHRPKPREKFKMQIIQPGERSPVRGAADDPRDADVAAPRSSNPVSFMELAAHHCRYPIGESPPYTFCGARKQEGSSYCRHHHEITTTDLVRSRRQFTLTTRAAA